MDSFIIDTNLESLLISQYCLEKHEKIDDVFAYHDRKLALNSLLEKGKKGNLGLVFLDIHISNRKDRAFFNRIERHQKFVGENWRLHFFLLTSKMTKFQLEKVKRSPLIKEVFIRPINETIINRALDMI